MFWLAFEAAGVVPWPIGFWNGAVLGLVDIVVFAPVPPAVPAVDVPDAPELAPLLELAAAPPLPPPLPPPPPPWANVGEVIARQVSATRRDLRFTTVLPM